MQGIPKPKRGTFSFSKTKSLCQCQGKKKIGRAKRIFPLIQWHHLRFVSWDWKRAFVKVTGTPDSSSLFWKCTALVASFWRVGLGISDVSPWLEGRGQRR